MFYMILCYEFQGPPGLPGVAGSAGDLGTAVSVTWSSFYMTLQHATKFLNVYFCFKDPGAEL